MTSEIHALSGAYAVGALDETERAQFERHLAQCSECRAEVASLREAAAALADDGAVAPPPALRDAVLADIGRVRPLPPETDRRSPAASRRLPLLVAAAVLAAVGVGVAVTEPWDRTDGTSQQQLTASERVLRAPDAQEVSVHLPGGASATVTRSVREGRAVITTHDMDAPPPGRVYQLWLQQSDGSMTDAGLMPERADQTMLLEGDAADVTGAGITVEPAGGSPQPTSDPIALFDLSGSA